MAPFLQTVALLLAIAALLRFPLVAGQQVVEFTVQPSNTTVQSGQAFNLSCTAVLVGNASTVVSYSWTKDGESFNTTLQILQFSSAVQTDEGVYVCSARVGGVTANSNPATVIVIKSILSPNEVIIIAIPVSVGILIIILISIVLFAWCCSLCVHKRHIWDKAPSRPHPQLADPLLMEEGAEDADATAYNLKHKRSKSLNFLYSTSSTGLMDNAATLSTEQLLTASRPTDITGLEDDRETLDFDLNLDESLFAENGEENRANSEGDLKTLAAPKLHRDDTIFKMGTHRRASAGSYSDVISEASDLMDKSVRFEVDELADSGIVTGNSTPHHGEMSRRASEPEFKQARLPQRRSSAPECNGSLTEEITSGEPQVENIVDAVSIVDAKVGELDGIQNDTSTFSETSITSSGSEDATRKIAKLISVAENWKSSQSGDTPAVTQNVTQSVTQAKVTEMRSKFLVMDAATGTVTEGKRTKHVSQLVSEKTKLLLQEQQDAPQPLPPTPTKRMKLKTFSVKQQPDKDNDNETDTSRVEESDSTTEVFDQNTTTTTTGPGDPATGSDAPTTGSGDPATGSGDLDISDEEEEQADKEEDLLMENFFASRQAFMPIFSSPVGLSQWQQPPTLSEALFDDDSDDDSDDELLEPLKMLTPARGSPAILLTPFGKSFLAPKTTPKSVPTATAKSAMREIRRTQLACGEPFNLQSHYRRKVATLSAIPEESPELRRSTHSMIPAQD